MQIAAHWNLLIQPIAIYTTKRPVDPVTLTSEAVILYSYSALPGPSAVLRFSAETAALMLARYLP